MTENRSENQRSTSELAGQQEVPIPGQPTENNDPNATVSELKPRPFSIRELSFMGPSNDGTRLLLVDSDGNQFELPVDNRLISVVSREHAPKPKNAAQSSAPSPREIQHRVRHGASIQDIAQTAAVSEEQIARFAHPVITERSHMATRAQSAPVTIDGQQLSLAEAVSNRLASRGIENHDLRWDAWRREDGEWTVTVAYPANMGEEVATFSYEPADSAVSASGDQATWILEQSTKGPRSVPSLSSQSDSTRQAPSPEKLEPATIQPRDTKRSETPPDPTPPAPERARSWDRAHPAAKAHERRGAAAEQAAEQPVERVENAAQGRAEHPASGSSESASSERNAASESEKETPQWEELLFGSPKDDDQS